jgi:hypothetical protein
MWYGSPLSEATMMASFLKGEAKVFQYPAADGRHYLEGFAC